MNRKMCFLSVMILAVSVWLFQGCGKREQSRDTGKYDYLDDRSLSASRAYVALH